MKKMVILAGVTFLAALCSKIYAHTWTVGMSEYTLPAEAGVSPCNREIGTQLDLNIRVTDNFYIINGGKIEDEHINYFNEFGYTFGISIFHPYAEIGYTAVDDSINYDFGLSTHVGKSFRPFVELSNFADKEKKTEKYGAQFQLTKSVYVEGAYEVTNQQLSDNVKFGLFLQF